MSKTKQWLLFYFGTAFQCDSPILEALDYALPPSSRDIWKRLSNDCSVQNLIDHLNSIPGWTNGKRGSNSDSRVIFPTGSSSNWFAFSGQLELDWSSKNCNYLYEYHLRNPNYFSLLMFDKNDNLHSLRILHNQHNNRWYAHHVAHFDKEELLNLKTLKDQLLFSNSKLYELIKLD